MQTSTTVRVTTETRDSVKQLADTDGVTLDVEIQRLVRAERQRRIGAALATAPVDTDWLNASLSDVRNHAGR
jgi:hypothetical protein